LGKNQLSDTVFHLSQLTIGNHSQRVTELLGEHRTLDTSWAIKFNGVKADAELNAAEVRSIHEKADPSQAS
jgi:hypothetical protein